MKFSIVLLCVLCLAIVATANVVVYSAIFEDTVNASVPSAGTGFVTIRKFKGENPYRLSIYSTITTSSVPTSAVFVSNTPSVITFPNITLNITLKGKKGSYYYSSIELNSSHPRLFQESYVNVNLTVVNALDYGYASILVTYNKGNSQLIAYPYNTFSVRRYLATYYSNASNNFYSIAVGDQYSTSPNLVSSFDLYNYARTFFSTLGLTLRTTTYTNDSSTVTSVGWYSPTGALLSTLSPRVVNGSFWDLSLGPGVLFTSTPVPGNYSDFFANYLAYGTTYLQYNLSTGASYFAFLTPTCKFTRRYVPQSYVITSGVLKGNTTSALGTRVNHQGGSFSKKNNKYTYITLLPDPTTKIINATFTFPIGFSNASSYLVISYVLEANVYQTHLNNFQFNFYSPVTQAFDQTVGFYNHTGTYDYFFSEYFDSLPTFVDFTTNTVSLNIYAANVTGGFVIDMLTIRQTVSNHLANPRFPAL